MFPGYPRPDTTSHILAVLSSSTTCSSLLVSLYSRPHFEYTYQDANFRRAISRSRDQRGARRTFLFISFYFHSTRYSRISFIHPFSCNEKEQCYETRNIYIYKIYITYIYIYISFNPPPSLGNYPESLLCHFPSFSRHFHSCTAFVRLPHCFLAFHRTCTDRPVRITQHCRSPHSLSLSPALIKPGGIIGRKNGRSCTGTKPRNSRYACSRAWVYTSGKMLVKTAWLSLALLLAERSMRLKTGETGAEGRVEGVAGPRGYNRAFSKPFTQYH